MIKRTHIQTLTKRLKETRNYIQILAGPRQTGKTTLALQLLEEPGIKGFYAAADDISSLGSSWIELQWETARQLMRKSGEDPFVLIIDEIQKVPDWSEIVKRMWDDDTRKGLPLHVLLLGSSRLLHPREMTESLAGRFELMYIGHWSLGEMNEAFGWSPEQYAWFGGYPGAASLIADESRWKDYILDSLAETSLSRDILMHSRIDKPALMKRLFTIGCTHSGEVLSFNRLLDQLPGAGNTTTLANYLNHLDTAGLLGGLEKFNGEMIRKRSSSPKFQVYNTAFSSALDPAHFQQATANREKWGRIVESAIGAHLINSACSSRFSLYYWKEGNHSVNFVLEHKGRVVALEVRTGFRTSASGLPEFRKRYPDSRVLIVGKDGFPWEEFLLIHPMNLFN